MENESTVSKRLADIDCKIIFSHVTLERKINILIMFMIVFLFLSAYGIFIK